MFPSNLYYAAALEYMSLDAAYTLIYNWGHILYPLAVALLPVSVCVGNAWWNGAAPPLAYPPQLQWVIFISHTSLVLYEGVYTPEDVETIISHGFGDPSGDWEQIRARTLARHVLDFYFGVERSRHIRDTLRVLTDQYWRLRARDSSCVDCVYITTHEGIGPEIADELEAMRLDVFRVEPDYSNP